MYVEHSKNNETVFFCKKCIIFKFKFFNLYFSSPQTLLLKQILLFVI